MSKPWEVGEKRCVGRDHSNLTRAGSKYDLIKDAQLRITLDYAWIELADQLGGC